MLIYQNGTITKIEARKPEEDEIAFVYMANPSDADIQHIVGEVFDCHPLVVQNCKTWVQRPLLDRDDHYSYMSFFILKEDWDLHEMSIVFGRNFVITIFQEEVAFLEEIKRELIRSPNKMKSAGMLLYEILHICVGDYSGLVDSIEERVDKMEKQIYLNPYSNLAPRIFRMKRKLHRARHIFAQERDILGTFIHTDLLQEEDLRYLTDVFQHTSQVIEMVDTFRDSLTGLIELQMSIKGDKMNGIMKTLTIFNAIFLPMMFIVGLYGTNMHLPEYSWSKNYLWLWGWLVSSVIFMIIFFKKKKWM